MPSILAKKRRTELLRCKDDPWYFLTEYAKTWVIEEDYTGPAPFPKWDYLRDKIVYPLRTFNNLHVEKSRQVLVSWAVMGVLLWDMTFKSGIADLVISQKELKVDDGGSKSTFESLFGKLRIMWRSLPDWLRPELEFKYLKIICPLSGSILWGETTTSDSGRGGTVHRAYLDEAAAIERSEEVWASVSPMALSGIIVSTPKGRRNLHGRIRFDPNSNFLKVIVDWRDRPDRDEVWYKRKTQDMLPHLVAQEYDRSYSASQPGRVFWNFERPVHVPEGGVKYDAKYGPVYRGWDFGVAAQTAIVWAQRVLVYFDGRSWPQLRIFKSYHNTDKPAKHYADVVKGVQDQLQHGRAVDFGDPSGWNRDSSLSSWVSNLADEGVEMIQAAVQDNGQVVPPEDRVDRVRWYMQKREQPLIVMDAEECPDLVDAVELWAYPTEQDGTRKEGSKPLKDWASHLGDALTYDAWELFEGWDPQAVPRIYVPPRADLDIMPVVRTTILDEEW